MVDNKTMVRFVTIGLLVAVLVLAIFVIKDIAISVFIGLLMAYIFYPLYRVLLKAFRKPFIATIALVAVILIFFVSLIIFIAPTLVEQTINAYVFLQGENVNAAIQVFLQKFVSETMAYSITVQIGNIISQIFSALFNNMTALIVELPSLFLQFAVVLFTFFFATKDASKLGEYLSTLSPFSASTEKKFFLEFRNVTNAVVYGQILIGLIQAAVLGIGLFVLEVPNALVLTFVAALFCIIPVLGSWLVWLPVSIALLFTGQTSSAVFLLIYGMFIVSTIDNFLRPYILSKNSSLNIAIALIGTIGGLYTFGIIGLVLGPLILAYVVILLEFYRQGKFNEVFKD